MTAEPEVTTRTLQEGDEFLLLGCDGLWDVFPSQRAVEFARARSVLQLGTAMTPRAAARRTGALADQGSALWVG